MGWHLQRIVDESTSAGLYYESYLSGWLFPHRLQRQPYFDKVIQSFIDEEISICNFTNRNFVKLQQVPSQVNLSNCLVDIELISTALMRV